MSKVKKPRPDNIKNYFYLLNKTKYELFEPQVDGDHELIDKIKRNFIDHTEEYFIDELIFCRLDNLYSLEDFLQKKIFEVLHNIYTEKNAIDLMNEELDSKKSASENSNKNSKKKKNKKKKYIVTGGVKNEDGRVSQSKNSCEDKSKSPLKKCQTDIVENIEREINETKSNDFVGVDEVVNDNNNKHNLKQQKVESNINYSQRSLNLMRINPLNNENEIKENSVPPSKLHDNLQTKCSLTNKEYNKKKEVYKNSIKNTKMSWRKMTPQQPLPNPKKKEDEETPRPLNNEEKYVSDLVKNLLSQIISDDTNSQVLNKTIDNDHDDLSVSQKSKTNKKKNKNKSNKKNEISTNYTKNNINKSSFTQNKTKSNNSGNTSINEIHGNSNKYNKNKNYSKSFKKENVKNSLGTNHSNLQSYPKNSNTKNTIYNMKRDFYGKEDNGNEILVKPLENVNNNKEQNSNNITINLTSSKSYSSDNECKIESITHEIIQGGGNVSGVGVDELNDSVSKRVMVDSCSQTFNNNHPDHADCQINCSENIHSTTHDEEEKPKKKENVKTDKNISEQITNQSKGSNSIRHQMNGDHSTTKQVEKQSKKKKKNLYINNFRDSENTNSTATNNSISPSNPFTQNKVIASSQNNCLDLKKCTSDGYHLTNNKSNPNASFPSNHRHNSDDFSYNDEEYFNAANYENNSHYNQGHYKYKYKGGHYGYKRNKYHSNYYSSSNKYENPYGYNKHINSRSLYSGPTMRVNPEIGASVFYPGFVSPSAGLYNPMYAGNIPFASKDSPVYNNFYIVNSNVNINNMQNFSQGTEEEADTANSRKSSKDILMNSTPGTNNTNMMSSYQNTPVCNNYNFLNLSPSNSFPGLFTPTSSLLHHSQPSHTEETSLNILQKIENEIYPFIFYYRLHNDILDYSNSIIEAISYLKETKLYIINYLEKSIKQALGYEMSIDLYGSFATDLSIESSDIDMTIKFQEERTEMEIEEVMQILCTHFKTLMIFENINPIIKTSVPVIKLLIDPNKVLDVDSEEYKKFQNISNTEFFKNYKFDTEELLKIKVDLTFIELANTTTLTPSKPPQSTKNSLDWAKKTLSVYPEIKPIIHVLKRYLQIKKLNSSFNGGLSSFSLFLLIVAYLKYPKIKTRINLGRILMEMLELFGKCFPYAQSIIDINSSSPFVFTNDFLENFPVILDPITGLNVAKNSFRIEEVREAFSTAYDSFNHYKILYDKKDLPSTTNVVLDLMLKCNGSCVNLS